MITEPGDDLKKCVFMKNSSSNPFIFCLIRRKVINFFSIGVIGYRMLNTITL